MSQAVDTSHLADHVAADTALSPEERETIIRWTGVDDNATVFSEERGVMLSLLRSPIATIDTIRVLRESEMSTTVPVEEHTGGDVTGVHATVPIGAVLVKSEARESNNRAPVISDYQHSNSE